LYGCDPCSFGRSRRGFFRQLQYPAEIVGEIVIRRLRQAQLEIRCPGCEQTFSYEGEAPRFCQDCGQAFASTVELPPKTTIDAEATIAPTTGAIKPQEPTGVGETVGPYQLVRWLGSGGMGNVWEAIETKTGRRVALKRLAKSMVSDETYVKRFVREAQLAGQISHPKVTFIYGAGNDKGQPYIAMELMPGKTLADKVQEEGPMAFSLAVDGVIDVVEGLISAHRLGMIHRDVKPSNCFLDTDESVKIGDFGLSKSLSTSEVNLTQTGTFLGTPSYAAPEQIRGSELDGRTDVYAVGATLFFLLTGRTPFLGDAMSVTAQIISDHPPSCSTVNNSIPKDLGRVTSKCLEKEPSKRFQDLEELRLALHPFATQRESIADVGRRLAAYMIDQILIQTVVGAGFVCWTILSVIYLQPGQHVSAEETAEAIRQGAHSVMFWEAITSWTVTMFYYSYFEGRFGRGLGKRLMGLKVVNVEGQKAGFGRALVRASMVPGGFGIPLCFDLWQSIYGTSLIGVEDYFALLTRSLALTYIPTLIFVSTMRASNRMLGIHGMLSGTRVIRLNTGKQKIKVPVVQPRPGTIDVLKFGPYETRELMGESRLGKVFIGHDEPLNRDVWIVVCENGLELSSERINLARGARQRWLEGGFGPNGQRWDAFEAIHGVPIQTFVGLRNKADWSLFGRLMLEIVDELQQAQGDGTLPESLTLPQIWLDQDGHAQLLDKQLVNVVSGDSTTIHDTIDSGSELVAELTPIERSVGMVQEMGDLFRRTKVLPSSVQDFLIELAERPKDESTLEWAKDQLATHSNRVESLTWDSRLGVLSATMGIELIVYSLVASAMFMFCYFVAPIPNPNRFFAGLGLGLVLPMALSCWFGGGPVFRFMGIQVCNSRGRKSSGLVCALRAAISWTPAIAFVGVFILLIIQSEAQTSHVEPEVGTLTHDLKNRGGAMLGVKFVLFLSTVSLVIGLLVTVASPRKGLVDFLLRTRLMPK
jgi:uncharacterized RDD family membrane protein YckC